MPKPSTKSTASKVEKPVQDDTRDALLSAARDLFLKNTYANISIRKIADKAKVNSAMIAYYFGSKSGLFREMVKSYIESKIEMATATIGHANQTNLQAFIGNFYQTVPPELTHLILRTMLFERGEMRDWLMQNLMKPAFDTALQVSQSIVDHNGKPVEPLIVRTLLQSMLLTPVLLNPLLKELHPDEINPEFYARLAEFQAELVGQYFELEKN